MKSPRADKMLQWLAGLGNRTVALWQREVPLPVALAHGGEAQQLFPILTGRQD